MILGSASRLAFVALLCGPLLACSVASYRKPVEDFAQATRDTAEALNGLDRQIRDADAERMRKQVIAQPDRMLTRKGDCLDGSKRCQIVVIDEKGQPRVFPPESRIPKILAVMAAIQRYADGLAAIVTADTAAQVTTHVNATVASLKNLAATVKEQGGGDKSSLVSLTEYATPVGNLANWLSGQYVAKLQLDGLRRATKDARAVVSEATDVLVTNAGFGALIWLPPRAHEVEQRMATLEKNASARAIDDLVTSAGQYDRLLESSPALVFTEFHKSHEALAKKLNDEEGSLSDAIEKIDVFSGEAKKLAAVVKELQAVSKK